MASRLDREDLGNLARVISNIFADWNVKSAQQKGLLGGKISAKALRAMQGGVAFPDDDELLSRAEHLLAIHDCLRTAYPRSGGMASHWLNQANRHFGRRTPLSVMLEGMPGLRQVRGHLDCTQNWID